MKKEKKLCLIGYSPAGHRGFIYLKRENNLTEEADKTSEQTAFLFKKSPNEVLSSKSIEQLMQNTNSHQSIH